MDISQERSRQPATSRGLGTHFTSPVKKRPGKRKTRVMTTIAFDAGRKRQRLQADLDEILASELPVIPEEEAGPTHGRHIEEQLEVVAKGEEPPEQEPSNLNCQGPEDLGCGVPESYPEDDNILGNQEPAPTKKRRITPNQAATILHEKWNALLPLLVDDILVYSTTSVGTPIQTVGSELKGLCSSPSSCSNSSDLKATKVTCLYFDRKLDYFFGCEGFLTRHYPRFQDHHCFHLLLPLREPSPCSEGTFPNGTISNPHGHID